jgi:hypothetical protein
MKLSKLICLSALYPVFISPRWHNSKFLWRLNLPPFVQGANIAVKLCCCSSGEDLEPVLTLGLFGDIAYMSSLCQHSLATVTAALVSGKTRAFTSLFFVWRNVAWPWLPWDASQKLGTCLSSRWYTQHPPRAVLRSSYLTLSCFWCSPQNTAVYVKTTLFTHHILTPSFPLLFQVSLALGTILPSSSPSFRCTRAGSKSFVSAKTHFGPPRRTAWLGSS